MRTRWAPWPLCAAPRSGARPACRRGRGQAPSLCCCTRTHPRRTRPCRKAAGTRAGPAAAPRLPRCCCSVPAGSGAQCSSEQQAVKRPAGGAPASQAPGRHHRHRRRPSMACFGDPQRVLAPPHLEVGQRHRKGSGNDGEGVATLSNVPAHGVRAARRAAQPELAARGRPGERARRRPWALRGWHRAATRRTDAPLGSALFKRGPWRSSHTAVGVVAGGGAGVGPGGQLDVRVDGEGVGVHTRVGVLRAGAQQGGV